MIYSLFLHLHSTKGTERTPFKFAPVDATGRPSFTTLPLSLSFLVIPRVPFLLLIFWMSRGCTERNIVFPPPRPSSSLSLPFSFFHHVWWWTAPQYSPFRSIPLSVLSLSTRNDRNASMHPASEAVHNRRRRRRRPSSYPLARLLRYKLLYRVITAKESGSGGFWPVILFLPFFIYLFVLFYLHCISSKSVGREKSFARLRASLFRVVGRRFECD